MRASSAHTAWVKKLTQAAWAELDCQTVQSDLAIILDFHSVWYRDHLVQYRAKLEQLCFGLTGPNIECTLFRNKRFMLDEKSYRNPSK